MSNEKFKNEKFFLYEDPIELYTQFKIEFYALIQKNILKWSGHYFIIEAFDNLEFDKVRTYIDNKVQHYSELCIIGLETNLEDEQDKKNFRLWKEVEDMYLLFDEIYTDLIETNIK